MKKRTRTNLFFLGCMAVLLNMFVGCSKLTVENYDKIEMGMPYEDVVGLLGQPGECGGAMGIKNCTWGDEDRFVTVNFVAEKVILFSAKGL